MNDCVRARRIDSAAKTVLLGDAIESALTGIGITKERWAGFVEHFGVPPATGCGGCDNRQEDLNAADLWMRNAAAELGSAATTAISKIWAPISWFKNSKTEPFQSGIPPEQTPTMKD